MSEKTFTSNTERKDLSLSLEGAKGRVFRRVDEEPRKRAGCHKYPFHNLGFRRQGLLDCFNGKSWLHLEIVGGCESEERLCQCREILLKFGEGCLLVSGKVACVVKVLVSVNQDPSIVALWLGCSER